jgi:hypothetical protein
MGYQNAPATITTTRDGQPVEMRIDYDLKLVRVFIAGQHVGTYGSRTTARQVLDLIEVPAPKKGRRAA